MKKDIDICPCGSGLSYTNCCGPFHQKQKTASQAEELLRSRYSAYALHNPSYIIETTHPASPEYIENHAEWTRKIKKFVDHTSFQRLEILEKTEFDRTAFISFAVYILQDQKGTVFTEKSHFEKIRDIWYYRSSEVLEGREPNFLTLNQVKTLPIAYYGDEVLWKKAFPIEEVTEDIRTLAKDMIETMDVYNGVGLAAPQVHHSVRMFITRADEKKAYTLGEPQVVINPKIIASSKETSSFSELCISIPTFEVKIIRPKTITVEYMNLEGKVIHKELSGYAARVFQHELDHLNGILIVDHLSKQDKRLLEPHLQRLKSRLHAAYQM